MGPRKSDELAAVNIDASREVAERDDTIDVNEDDFVREEDVQVDDELAGDTDSA